MNNKPSYSAADVRSLFLKTRRIITEQATKDAFDLGFDDKDIEYVVCTELQASHFYKTMESEKFPGTWQDVYKLKHRGVALYVKLQVRVNRGGPVAVVVSFKRDESSL